MRAKKDACLKHQEGVNIFAISPESPRLPSQSRRRPTRGVHLTSYLTLLKASPLQPSICPSGVTTVVLAVIRTVLAIVVPSPPLIAS